MSQLTKAANSEVESAAQASPSAEAQTAAETSVPSAVPTEVRWTPDQDSAIRSRKANLLVSAAAGSGKTAVLVERILQLISEDRIPIRNMLIVTFTNAAAGEMRTRIIKALSAKLKEPGADALWLREQLERAGNAYIMTLHAFCNDLVRKHFYKVDMDPAFRVGDATLLKSLREEAAMLTLEAAYEAMSPDFSQFIEAFSGNRTDEKIEALLWDVHGFIQSQPDPKAWLVSQTEALEAHDAEDSLWLKSLLQMISEELEGLMESHRETEQLCMDPSGPMGYLPAIQSDLELLERLMDSMKAGYAAAYDALADLKFDKLKPIRGAEAELVDPALKDAVLERRDLVKDYIKRLGKHFFSQSPDALDQSIHRLLPGTRALSDLVITLEEQYGALKKEAGVIDFYDLEHLAIDILKDEEIAGMYRAKFDHIFLDEYQDSNLVQETVVRAIAREDNVFLVGDVKQSIYKFRLADPTLFMDKLNSYSRDEGARNRIIDLSANFRTRPELIERVNGFFEKVMTLSLGEVVYDHHARLNPGLSFPEEAFPSLSLTLIDTGKAKSGSDTEAATAVGATGTPESGPAAAASEPDADETDPEFEEALSYMKNAELEAHVVAELIKDTLKTDIYDPKLKRHRKPAFRDVVILMRSPKAAAETYVQVLSQYGLPVRADGVGAKISSFEMQAALSLLKVLDNSRLDLDLLTVLRSPIGGFSTDELAAIRTFAPQGTFRDAVTLFSEAGSGAETGLSSRLRDFLSRLEVWSGYATFERVGDFVWRLMIETGLLDYARAMPEGELRSSQLMKLVERAGDYEAALRGDLSGFIKVLEEGDASEFSAEVPKTLSEDEDFIRIMSIHKSKGLEFPIVFLADTGKKFNMRDTYGDLLLHKDLGIALKEIDAEKRTYRTSLPQLAIQKAIEREALSEELRILYVALTRAVDRLYVTGSTKFVDKALANYGRGCLTFAMRQAKSLLDWMGAYAAGEEVTEAARWGFKLIRAEDQIRAQTFETASNRALDDLMESAAGHALDTAVIRRLDSGRILKAAHGDQDETQAHASVLPSKVSVSELKALEALNQTALNRAMTLEVLYKPELTETPRFMAQESSAAMGAVRGSAFHTVLQYMNFSRMAHKSPNEREKVFDEEKQRLVREGRLEQTLADDLGWPELAGFFDHPLFQRLLGARTLEREKAYVLKRGSGRDFSLIQGIVDLYFEDEQGLVLVDYKTDRVGGPQAVSLLKQRYSTQLGLYAEALEKLTGRQVEAAWLYAAHLGQWINVELTGREKEELS